MQIAAETDFHTYGIRQVQHAKIIKLVAALAVSRFPWKAVLSWTCHSKVKKIMKKVL